MCGFCLYRRYISFNMFVADKSDLLFMINFESSSLFVVWNWITAGSVNEPFHCIEHRLASV